MKTITTQQETVLTLTSYVCDVPECQFATDSHQTAKTHFADRHSFVEIRKIGNNEWFRFETLENYRAFHKDGNRDNSNRHYIEKAWEGPGWYRCESWLDRHGEYEIEAARSLRYWEEDWKEKIRDQLFELRAVRTLKETK